MDPARTFCPQRACAARGQTGQGNIGIHSRKEPRFLCTACRKTFTATQGIARDRRRTAAATVRLVVTLIAHGCPLQAIVVALGSDARTVARWLARAGRQGQAVQEHLVEQPRDLGQVQADAIRVTPQGRSVWRALAMMGRTRVWRAGEVKEQRAMALMRQRIERVRRGAAHRALLCCPDGVCASLRAMREPFRDPPAPGAPGRPRRRPWRNRCIAQVVQRSVQRRVVAVERRMVDGTPARGETLRRRSPGDGVINTASIERLNATFRARLALLTRRGRALARRTRTVPHGMDMIGPVSTFCTPHASVPQGAGGATPPAMAAGIADHCWTVQAWLSFPVPPPRWSPPKQRGRRSHTLQRLIERCCTS